MRVGELSRQTGVSVPTIKYYLREGLLARGDVTHPNQASYGEPHVHRVRLIRALTEIGGLTVARAREVLAELDGGDADLDRRLGQVVGSINRPSATLEARDRAAARVRMEQLSQAHGWSDGDPDYPARRSLEEVLATLDQLGATALLANLDRYAEVATRIAEIDLDALTGTAGTGVTTDPDSDRVLEQAIVGTVLGDVLLACLRRVAQAAESGRRREG